MAIGDEATATSRGNMGKQPLQSGIAVLIVVTVLLVAPYNSLTVIETELPEVAISPIPALDEDAESVTLHGAGSTFVFPLMSKWSFEFNKVKPNVLVNYQSVGSGAGIRQIVARTVDFGASDVPMNEEEFNASPGILHIPITLGAVAVVYNLPGISTGLRLTGEVLAEIYLGKIRAWNDPKISNLNPDLKLPDKEILVIHRSDGSGTTFVFTEYLSSVSVEWREKVGKGKVVNWPVGLGAKGNEGVTGVVKQNPYAIGYTEASFARLQGLDYAFIMNRAGEFVGPSLQAISQAAAGIGELPKGEESWNGFSIINAEKSGAYPIASLVYLLVYKEQPSRAKATALAEFIWWITHEGQALGPELLYAPLPEPVVKLNEETIHSISFRGEPMLKR